MLRHNAAFHSLKLPRCPRSDEQMTPVPRPELPSRYSKRIQVAIPTIESNLYAVRYCPSRKLCSTPPTYDVSSRIARERVARGPLVARHYIVVDIGEFNRKEPLIGTCGIDDQLPAASNESMSAHHSFTRIGSERYKTLRSKRRQTEARLAPVPTRTRFRYIEPLRLPKHSPIVVQV